jgi:hypothetical protein
LSLKRAFDGLSPEEKVIEDTRRAYVTISSMGARERLLIEEHVREVLEGAYAKHLQAFPDPLIDTG